MSAELLVPLLVSNAFAALLAFLCWRRPTAGRLLGATLFLGAAAFNAYQAATSPEVYATFRPFVWLAAYRWVIDAVFPAYGAWFIGAIALGQAAVGLLLARGGTAAMLGACGAIVFLLAITPLGLGSAFPFPLVAAAGFAAFLEGVDAGAARPRPAAPPPPAALVAPADLAALPPVVRRYFDFMGAPGRPRVWSLRSRFTGRFRLGLKGDWQACHGRAENRRGGAYRCFEMRMSYLGFLPLVVHDYYKDGAGGFQARVLGLVTVAEARGPELDAGELVTYLSEAVLAAPTLLLGPETAWRELDDHAFEVTLRDAGTTVTGRVHVDDRGAPVRFTTTDRFFVDPTDAKKAPQRTPWSVAVTDWATVDGRAVAIGAQAAWEFPEGPFAYGEVLTDPGSLVFNAPLGP